MFSCLRNCFRTLVQFNLILNLLLIYLVFGKYKATFSPFLALCDWVIFIKDKIYELLVMFAFKAFSWTLKAKLFDKLLFITCLIVHLPSYFLFATIFFCTFAHIVELCYVIGRLPW